jgi:hypothetical protein
LQLMPLPRQVKHRGFAVAHRMMMLELDGQYYHPGLLFGRGPDLHLDLNAPERCVSQIGSTYAVRASGSLAPLNCCSALPDAELFSTGQCSGVN